MRNKIFRNTFLVAAIVLLCSLTVILGCMYDYFGDVQENQLRDELSLAAVGVENSGLNYLARLRSDSYRLTWIAADGAVLGDTQADASQMENHAQRAEVQQALEKGEGQSSRYSATLTEKTIYCARRMDDGTVLRISVSRATAGLVALGMLQPILAVALAALLLSAWLSRRLSRRIVEPLNRLDLETTPTPTRSCRRCCGASTASGRRSTGRCAPCARSRTSSARSSAACRRGWYCWISPARC